MTALSGDVPGGGVVGLYDYGMMGKFSTSFRSSIAHLIAGLAEKDNRRVMNAIVDMSEDGSLVDHEKMLRDVEEFGNKHLNKPLAQMNLSVVLNSLLDLLRNQRLRMQGSFYLAIKAMSQVEAIGRELNPDLNFVLFGKPYAEELINEKYKPSHLLDLLKKLSMASIDFLEVLPGEFHILWNRVRRGQFNIPLEHKIDPEGFEPLRTTLDLIANRIANAILAASMLICSSILILSHIPPKIWNIPIIGFLGLSWGAYMSLRLILSIWKHGGL
jgi:ubiquinone biosynthesis protein